MMRVRATAVTVVHPNLPGCGTSSLLMVPGRKVCERTPSRRRQTSTLPFPCMLGLAVRLFSASNSTTISVVGQVASLTWQAEAGKTHCIRAGGLSSWTGNFGLTIGERVIHRRAAEKENLLLASIVR